MKLYITSFLLCLTFLVYAQEDTTYSTYNWQENPTSIDTLDFGSQDIIQLKDKHIVDFRFLDPNTLIEYDIEHYIYWLNSDEEIENFNKIYLPYNSSSSILKSKARVIKKDGSTIVLDESKIMSAKNEETGQEYKYFAFEGIEKGSAIEYFWIIKTFPRYSGKRVTLQNDIEKRNIEFDLYAPSNLFFKFKSYNGLDSITHDTLDTEQQHWYLKLNKQVALEDETYSAYHANKQFLVYKLDYNSTANVSNIISYVNSTKNIFEYFYSPTKNKVQKSVTKILKNQNIEIARDLNAKIRTIEDYIKNTIYYIDSYNPDLSDLSNILSKRIANESGMIKLFIEMFNQQDIEHELVITSDRFDLKFDQDFEANNFLDEYLFYFPEIDAYLSPVDLSSRLGFPTPEYTECYGLFIKKVAFGDFASGIGKIKYISGVNYQKNFDNIIVDVEFDKEDFTTTNLKIDRSSGGYYIKWLQPFMHILKEKDEALDEQITFINENIDINSKTVYNDDAKFFGIEPLRVVADAKSTVFVEKAGTNYLFKVGELIGPQSEMYQEKERTQPMEAYYRKNYHRVINVTIPEGYTIKNLDDINLHELYQQKEEEVMKFHSSYKIEGNKLIITADEYYDFIRLSKEEFEEYRRVMNAAADFNKVTLIFEKKD